MDTKESVVHGTTHEEIPKEERAAELNYKTIRQLEEAGIWYIDGKWYRRKQD